MTANRPAPSPETMTGGQALARALVREGVEVVFGIPGGGQYEAVDALCEEPAITYVSTRHEQAASFMADGFARVSGRLAAVLVVPGPGLCNAAAGMLTAAASSSPMLVITGTRHVPGDEEAGRDLLRPLAKWRARPQSPAAVAANVREAVMQAKAGRPQPVAIEISREVLASSAEVVFCDAEPNTVETVDAASIREAARVMRSAQRPAVFAGTGVHRAQATAALQSVAELLQAPVLTTRGGKGAISDRHPLSLGFGEPGYAPLSTWLEHRDAVLVIGARYGVERLLANPAQQVVRIDADASVMGGGETVSVAGDARTALAAMARELPVSGAIAASGSEPVHEQVRSLNSTRFDPRRQLQPQWDLMQAIRTALPDDGVLVQGMNQMGYYSRNYFPVYAPRAYLTSSTQITLGCAYPLALGAKMATPGRAVVSLSGDGGFLYNAQEMATAVQNGIGAIAVVFNDNAYGNVLRAQLEQFGGNVIGTRLHNPDFVDLAESFGMRAQRVDGATELGDALTQAIDEDAPALVEVPVGMMEREY